MNERTGADPFSRGMLAAVALLMVSCGGGGGGSSLAIQPPGIARNTVITGKVTAEPGAPSDPITIALAAEPTNRTTVAADGAFTLRGLTAGDHTLVITQRGSEMPRVSFPGTANDQQVTIELRQFADELVLAKEDRRGIGTAAAEFEGLVENALLVAPGGDSRFVIGSRSVVVRAGVTSIREGLTHRAVDDLTLGRRVQVRGATINNGTEVLAFQVRLQESDGSAYEKELVVCHAPPGAPSRFKTLTINSNAWAAHEPHNDAVGSCKP